MKQHKAGDQHLCQAQNKWTLFIVSIVVTTEPPAVTTVWHEVSSRPPAFRSLHAVSWHAGKRLVTTLYLALDRENTDLSSEPGSRCCPPSASAAHSPAQLCTRNSLTSKITPSFSSCIFRLSDLSVVCPVCEQVSIHPADICMCMHACAHAAVCACVCVCCPCT